MSNTSVKSFLSILESSVDKSTKIDLFDCEVDLLPLSFKQQKTLFTSGLNGVVGILSFVKILNDILIENTGNQDLKVYHKIPLVLNLKKTIGSPDIVKGEKVIKIDDVIKNIKKFEHPQSTIIECDGFSIHLKAPTLKEENKIISACIEDVKRNSEDDISKNVSLIMSYELPKFVDSITFGDQIIAFKELSSSDRFKIIDNLPATATTKITEFISIIRKYEEEIMTIDGVTIDIDSAFFE